MNTIFAVNPYFFAFKMLHFLLSFLKASDSHGQGHLRFRYLVRTHSWCDFWHPMEKGEKSPVQAGRWASCGIKPMALAAPTRPPGASSAAMLFLGVTDSP